MPSVPFVSRELGRGISGYRHLKTTTEPLAVLFRQSPRRSATLNAIPKPNLVFHLFGNQFIGLLLSGKVKEFSQVRGMKRDLARSTQRKHVRGRRGFLHLSPHVAHFSAGQTAVGSRSSAFFEHVVKLLINSQNLGIFSPSRGLGTCKSVWNSCTTIRCAIVGYGYGNGYGNEREITDVKDLYCFRDS